MKVLQLHFEIFYAYSLFPECGVSSNSLNNHHETYTHIRCICVWWSSSAVLDAVSAS